MESYLERNNQLWLVVMCLAAFVIVYFSPNNYGDSDPRGTLMTSQAILQLHTVALDDYASVAKGYQFGKGRLGHIYYGYPPGAVVFSLPFVYVANLRGMDMRKTDDDRTLQKSIVAYIAALCCLLIYLLSRCFVNYTYSFLLSAAFVFGSSVASTIGTALWSADFATLFSLICLLLLVYHEQQKIKRLNPYVFGLVLFLTYFSRPTAAVFVAIILAYLLIKYRAIFLPTLFTVGFFFVGLVGVYEIMYRKPFSPYYGGVAFTGVSPSYLIAVFAQAFSPSRGVLIFSPYLFITVIATVFFFRRLRGEPLFWLALGWMVAHTIVICLNPNFWGGASYGNRLFADAFPGLILWSLLVWRCILQCASTPWRRLATGLLMVTGALAIFINTAQGLYNPYAVYWNFGIDTGNNWQWVLNWKYSQFLSSPQLLFTRAMDKLQPYVHLKFR